jgi:hypothetical protein
MTRNSSNEGIPTLRFALDQYMNADEIKKLVAFIGLRPPTRKLELVEAVVKHLAGAGLRQVWEGLDELQQAAVAETVHGDRTRFDGSRFAAKYGRQPDWGSVESHRRDTPPTALRFFFYGFQAIMPDDVKERLKAFVPAPVAAQVNTVEALPAAYGRPRTWQDPESGTGTGKKATVPVPLTLRAGEQAAQRELVAVLRLVDAGEVAVSDKTRRASAATLAAIAAVLDGGDYYPHVPPKNTWSDENAGPIRAFAWPLLIQAGGLAQLAGSRLQLTKAGRKALAEPPAQTLSTLWHKWQTSTLLDELSRLDCVKGQTGKGKRGLTAVAGRRDAIAAALLACPTGRWVETSELFRFIQATDGGLSVSRSPWDLYVISPQYGSLGNSGTILEERYLFCLLLEYAATLGLIDVALIPPAGARADYGDMWGLDDLPFLSRYDGLIYFRINALGAYCLGSDEAYKAAPAENKPGLRVLPNLEVAATAAVPDPGDCLALDAYAVRMSPRVWQLQPAKLLAAVEAGRSIAELRGFLEARSADPLPGTVQRLFADTEARCARLQDRGQARLVECADPALAALIANDARTRQLCMRAGEQHLVIPAGSETAFRRALRELGYLLAAEAEPRRGKPGTPADHRGAAALDAE